MGTAIASASSGDSRVSWQQQPVSRGPCSAEGVPSMVSKLLSAAELTAARRSWVHGHRRLHGQGRQAPEVASHLGTVSGKGDLPLYMHFCASTRTYDVLEPTHVYSPN